MKADPIRETEEIKRIVDYLYEKEDYRNLTMICLGLNTALRVSDILKLKWKDVYDFERGKVKKHIEIVEQKTQKPNKILINTVLENTLIVFKSKLDSICREQYLFLSRKGKNRPISRIQMYRIMKALSKELYLDGNISCHSLRKTFGYMAYKRGVQPALIMEIFNHSSYLITKRYLGIEQDDKDSVYREIKFF